MPCSNFSVCLHIKEKQQGILFFPSTFFFFSTVSFASPSLGLIAHLWWSGHQQVPEHHVFPRSAVWASGCLPPVTPTVRDGPNLPAASHTSETAAGGMSRSTYISVWWWGCSVDILCCFFLPPCLLLQFILQIAGVQDLLWKVKRICCNSNTDSKLHIMS